MQQRRKIVVNRMPRRKAKTDSGSRMREHSRADRVWSQGSGVPTCGAMKARTITPTRVKSMLKKVPFTENLISTSFGRLSFLWQHFLVLDSNVKNENAGKSKREGCLRKVLKRVRCQVKVTPVIRPGRVSRGTGKGKIMRET